LVRNVLFPASMISPDATIIFERARTRAQMFKRMDAELLQSIEEVDRNRVYQVYGRSSLFAFCTENLELPESVTLNLINVMRKSRTVPELGRAVEQGLALTKARRIVPVITPENQSEWIAKARSLPKIELERAVATVNPALVERETAKPSAADRMKIEFYTSARRCERLRTAQDLVSTLQGRPANFDDTIDFAVTLLLEKMDPAPRASRAVTRTNASLKTKVFARDRGKCQMKLSGGGRCGSRRFLHLHHKRARCRGGVDHPDNLVTLCSGCHRAWHRRHGDVPLFEGSSSEPDG
jgi:hypothetical protein